MRYPESSDTLKKDSKRLRRNDMYEESSEYFVVAVPVKALERAGRILADFQPRWDALRQEREELRGLAASLLGPNPDALGAVGKTGAAGELSAKAQGLADEYEAKRAEIDGKMQAEIDETAERIAALRAEAMEAVAEQVTPHGADIAGNGEYILIRDGLVHDPEDLQQIVADNMSAAFRNAAQDYASRRGWGGFNYVSKLEDVKGYLSQMFDMYERAARVPNGYAIAQALAENEATRAAHAWDIDDCYQAGVKLGL